MKIMFRVKRRSLQNRALESAWPAEVEPTVDRLGNGSGATRRPQTTKLSTLYRYWVRIQRSPAIVSALPKSSPSQFRSIHCYLLQEFENWFSCFILLSGVIQRFLVSGKRSLFHIRKVGVYNTESEIGNDCHSIAQSGTNYLNSCTGFL